MIAVANQKGGVGKSTTAVSLGAALAELGYRVLVVDLDPQGNASTGLGVRHEAREVTVYDVLAAEAPMADAVIPTPVENLFAVPSTIDLAGAEIELVSRFSRELRLRKALEPLHEAGYDFIFLDCPPSLGLLTVNALAAAEELIVPIQCEYYALEGLGQLLRNVRLVQQNVNPSLQLTGIVMTMFDPRTKLSEQVVDEVRKFFGDRVYKTIIPRTVRLSEAPGFGQPITVYDPRSKGAECYRDLAREVAEREPPNEPMPTFDAFPTVVIQPPEPHVMTAPHPLSPAVEEEVEIEERSDAELEIEAEPEAETLVPPPEGAPQLDRTVEVEPVALAEPHVDVDRGSSKEGGSSQAEVETAGESSPSTPPGVRSKAFAQGPEVETGPLGRRGAEPRRLVEAESSGSQDGSRQPGEVHPAPEPTRSVEPSTIIVIDDEVDVDLPERPPQEEPQVHEGEEPPKRRWSLFRRSGRGGKR
ncbi:MAG TPA: AAA family ATPase [Actinomycetota bacterium]